MNTLNICVLDVAWNKPPYKPIPLSKYVKYKLSMLSKEEYNKIMMATRENSIDLSRLELTALENNNNKIEKITIMV